MYPILTMAKCVEGTYARQLVIPNTDQNILAVSSVTQFNILIFCRVSILFHSSL